MTVARTIAILTEARAKITDPRNWGKGIRPNRITPERTHAEVVDAFTKAIASLQRRAPA